MLDTWTEEVCLKFLSQTLNDKEEPFSKKSIEEEGQQGQDPDSEHTRPFQAAKNISTVEYREGRYKNIFIFY